MSNKVVFELVIVRGSLTIGTSLRLFDVKSVDLMDNLIRSKILGLHGKSAYMVYVVDRRALIDGGFDLDGIFPVGTWRFLGGNMIHCIPFYHKNGKRWVINQELYSWAGRSLSGDTL